MHAAIENNTLMMETFTEKPVSRYAVVTARDILVPILKFLIGNLPFMTEQARIMLQYKLLHTLLFDWRPCSQCCQLLLGWGDEIPRELGLFDWLLPVENKRLVPQKRHRHRVGGEVKDENLVPGEVFTPETSTSLSLYLEIWAISACLTPKFEF